MKRVDNQTVRIAEGSRGYSRATGLHINQGPVLVEYIPVTERRITAYHVCKGGLMKNQSAQDTPMDALVTEIFNRIDDAIDFAKQGYKSEEILRLSLERAQQRSRASAPTSRATH